MWIKKKVIIVIIFTIVLLRFSSFIIFSDTPVKFQPDNKFNQKNFSIEATVDIIFDNGDMMFYPTFNSKLRKRA